jgi:hypothetical protein
LVSQNFYKKKHPRWGIWNREREGVWNIYLVNEIYNRCRYWVMCVSCTMKREREREVWNIYLVGEIYKKV